MCYLGQGASSFLLWIVRIPVFTSPGSWTLECMKSHSGLWKPVRAQSVGALFSFQLFPLPRALLCHTYPAPVKPIVTESMLTLLQPLFSVCFYHHHISDIFSSNPSSSGTQRSPCHYTLCVPRCSSLLQHTCQPLSRDHLPNEFWVFSQCCVQWFSILCGPEHSHFLSWSSLSFGSTTSFFCHTEAFSYCGPVFSLHSGFENCACLFAY